METDKAIYFYGNSPNNKFNYTSNFYMISQKCLNPNDSITNGSNVDEIIFNCNKQYFMYRKCMLFDENNIELIEKILNETDPKKIKKYGREVNNFDQQIWDIYKYEIMKDGLIHKFTQNIDIKNKLIATKDKILYEASRHDKIWGIGYYANIAINKSETTYGQNLLGKALMEVREILIDKDSEV